MFRTLGLRHLVVVDSANRVVGIISRKDLIGHALERKLQHALIHAALEQHEPAWLNTDWHTDAVICS